MQDEAQWLPLFSGTAPGSWRARNAHLFPSDESLRHYFRQHKRELIDAGAVVYHRGQYQATEQMRPAVRVIAQRADRRAVEVSA
jgi:hypothetical protein